MCQSKFRQNSFTHLTCHKGCSDLVATVTVGIVFLLPTSSIKNRPHWMSHAPSCIARTFCSVIYVPHALHAPSLCPLTSSDTSPLVDVIDMCSVSCWHHLLLSMPHQSLMSSCLRHPLTCRVSRRCHWLWPLTLIGVDHWLFAKFDFLQSRCSLASFSHRFHFCIFFS